MRGCLIKPSASLFLLAILASSSTPAESPFTLPTAPPVPAPQPGTTLTLTAETLYVINSKVDATVRPHPVGLVSVTKETGPIRIRGKFVDGTGKVETRVFPGPFVFLVEAVGTGRCELDCIPFGLKSDTDILAVAINVDAGQGPIPPPKPKPDPKPEPVTSFRVFLVFESGQTLTAAQNSVLYGKVVEDCLNATCTDGRNGWRRRDQNVISSGADSPALKALWESTRPKIMTTPCLVIGVNDTFTVVSLPATPAETVALIKKYAEGK